MRRQSRRAAAGRISIAARLSRPLSKGTSQAPRMSISPGCTHSTVIIVLGAHQPELAQQFGHYDDGNARDEAVHRPPSREILERKMGFIRREYPRSKDFPQGNTGQTEIKP